MYLDLFQFIGGIRNVRSWSFFNVQRNNALIEFFSVMLNQNLEFSFFELFIYNKDRCFCSFNKF